MKKILVLLMVASMCISLVACGNSENSSKSKYVLEVEKLINEIGDISIESK